MYLGLGLYIKFFFLHLRSHHDLFNAINLEGNKLKKKNHKHGHSLTLRVTHHCRWQSRSLKTSASCLHPASVRSMCTTTAPGSPAEPRSRPPSPSLGSSQAGCSLLPSEAADAPAEFEPELRDLSSPPPVRPGGWRATAGKSARGTHRSGSLHPESTLQHGKNTGSLKKKREREEPGKISRGLQKERGSGFSVVFVELLQFNSNPHPFCST